MIYSVVIPIYKNIPNELEQISLEQCFRILKNHHITIVAPESLDVSFYTKKANEAGLSYSIEFFDSTYFKNIVGYNFLLLSEAFYNRFNNYDYILIYQLDCFVFKDELDYWAQKGFDYIGSPWFAHYMSYAEDRPFWYNGNGGFSLRRVDAFLNVLNWKFPLKNMRLIKTELLELKIHPVKRKVLSLLMYFGYNNNISSFLRKQKYAPNTLPEALFDGQKRGNEDTIWSNLFQETRVQIKAPNFEKGLGFSFEQSPDYLLRQNNNTLPFGCHAWWKYNMDFWQPYIEQYGFKIPQKNK